MKKIAYLGKIQLSDVDLSYLHEAQQLADITYIMEVTPRYMKGPALCLENLYPKSGLFKALEAYPEFGKYQGFVDLDKCYVLNTCGRLWLLKAFWTNLLLLLFLIRQRFTAIHLAWPPNPYEFILYFLRRRMLLTVHDPFPHTAHNTLIVRLRRLLAFRLIPRLILLNDAQRQDFIDFYRISPSRVIMSSLGSYDNMTVGVSDLPDGGGDFILFAGRISPYKGLDHLLPAMKEVHRVCPDCKLKVVGSGQFHFNVSEYQMSDYIEIRNRFIPDEELVELIRRAAFLVCPYTDATQSGVVMSAFAFHKPVIATRVGGLPEMVKDGCYGLIVKSHDVKALADAMIDLWKDEDKRRLFSQQIAHDYSDGDRSWKKIAKQLTACYQEE